MCICKIGDCLCLRKGYEHPKPLMYQENFYNLSNIVHTYIGWLSAMVKPTHELGIALMSKRNESWNGIMDSIIGTKGISM